MTTQGDTVPLLSVFNHHHRAIAIAALLALLHPTAQGQVTNQKAVGTAGSLPTEFLPRISPQNRNLALSRAGCDRKLEATIIAGLAGLKELQKPDGSWGGLNEYGTAALALMAFYGHGEGQKSSPFLETIRRGIQFLNSSRMSKYIVEMTAKNERVQLFERREWEMAMGAIAMAEHAILSEDASIRDTLSAHTVAILRQQLESGGWGPSATPSIGWKPIDANRKADICRTAWMVQALRASKMAGCAPPEVDAALAKAEQFVRSLSLPKGGFGCRLPEQDYLRSGIGAFVLASNQSAVNLPMAQRGLEAVLRATDAHGRLRETPSTTEIPLLVVAVLDSIPLRESSRATKLSTDFGANYYNAAAGSILGGTFWTRSRDKFIMPIAANQRQDGTWLPGGKSWKPEIFGCETDIALSNFSSNTAYRSALCILICETPYRFAPQKERAFFTAPVGR